MLALHAELNVSAFSMLLRTNCTSGGGDQVCALLVSPLGQPFGSWPAWGRWRLAALVRTSAKSKPQSVHGRT